MDGSWYSGEFSGNDICGYGHYIWASKNEYKGNWKANKMHGQGEHLWADGRKYVGSFHEDYQHGRGIFVTGAGQSQEGEWRNGKVVWAMGENGQKIMSKHMALKTQKTFNIRQSPRKNE